MNLLFWFFVFLFGASLGSFYITLGDRILKYFYGPLRKKYSFIEKFRIILTEPSACDHCATRIKWYYLVPVFGWIFTGKKCNSCGKDILPVYPVAEASAGLLLVYLFAKTGNPWLSVLLTLTAGHLLVSAMTDYYHYSLDYENLPFIALFGFSSAWLIGETDLTVLYTGAGFLVFYSLLWYFFRNGIGMGDVTHAPVFAMVAGHPWWLLFLNFSYILAVFFTVITRKKGESLRHKKIPMGIYFSLGLILTLLFKIHFLY